MKITGTPGKRWQLAVIGSLAYLLWPIAESVYHWENLQRHFYPIDADSISIPIFRYIVGWLFVAPFYVVTLYLSCRNYQPGVSLVSLPKLKTREVLWSILFGAMILFLFLEIYRGIQEFHLFSIINAIFQMWVILLMHASMLHKTMNGEQVR